MLTKSDLLAIKQLIDVSIDTLIEEFGGKLDSLKNELKNDITNFKDTIIGRLDKIDEELTVTNGYGDKIENHEERITKLETKQPVPA